MTDVTIADLGDPWVHPIELILHWGIWETWEYMNRDKVYGNTLRFISGSWELDATLF